MAIQCDTETCNQNSEGECLNKDIKACFSRTLEDVPVVYHPNMSTEVKLGMQMEGLASALAYISAGGGGKMPIQLMASDLRGKAKTALEEAGYTYISDGTWKREDS